MAGCDSRNHESQVRKPQRPIGLLFAVSRESCVNR